MLILAALSRAFGGLKVIERLDLTVEVGDVLGVIGPNGAGKSTLFNMIAGVLPPSSGRILFDGRDITAMKPWDRSRIGIGRTYQVPKPFTHMSVFENVLVAATARREDVFEPRQRRMRRRAAERRPHTPRGNARRTIGAPGHEAARTGQSACRATAAPASRRDRRRTDRGRDRDAARHDPSRSMRAASPSSGSNMSFRLCGVW